MQSIDPHRGVRARETQSQDLAAVVEDFGLQGTVYVDAICDGARVTTTTGGYDVRRSVDEEEDLREMPEEGGGGADGDAEPDFGEVGGATVRADDGDDGGGHEGFREAVEPGLHLVGEVVPGLGYRVVLEVGVRTGGCWVWIMIVIIAGGGVGIGTGAD